MITLNLSEKQLDDLYEEMSSNDNLRAREKMPDRLSKSKGLSTS